MGVLFGVLTVSAVASSTETVVRSTYNPSWSRVLVGPTRHSLYVFCSPHRHGRSWTCSGRHAHGWPPVIAHGRVVAARGSGIHARELGSVKLKSGQRQVTYFGNALYYYRGDHKPGQINGQAKHEGAGVWSLISPVDGKPARSSTY